MSVEVQCRNVPSVPREQVFLTAGPEKHTNMILCSSQGTSVILSKTLLRTHGYIFILHPSNLQFNPLIILYRSQKVVQLYLLYLISFTCLSLYSLNRLKEPTN